MFWDVGCPRQLPCLFNRFAALAGHRSCHSSYNCVILIISNLRSRYILENPRTNLDSKACKVAAGLKQLDGENLTVPGKMSELK